VFLTTSVKKTLMSELSDKECKPCLGGVPPLKGETLQELHNKLGSAWQIIDEHHLEREFKFKNFQSALDFVNQVGALAESVNHHPELRFSWGWVRILLWTHKIDGLAENDFIMAAKFDELCAT
jgi:4a-hydroxytetrahydrobiopterin dehydratase